jgi:hypothetical protein
MTRPTAYEPDRVAIGGVLLVGLALAVLTAAGLLIAAQVTDVFIARTARPLEVAPSLAERRLPPAPRLQSDPAAALAAHRRSLDERLGSYGWIDRSAGIARIPVERAMDLVARDGLPDFAEEGR